MQHNPNIHERRAHVIRALAGARTFARFYGDPDLANKITRRIFQICEQDNKERGIDVHAER